ncbi:MAG: ergothioneine biosynthesis protein EgtB [Bacteroidota bacterium]|nr:ergothioneine biosynthesis protein EgtB [Bacteroidota bacterium]
MEVLENISLRYKNVRDKSLEICKPLSPEDFVVQPIDDVSPPKWHMGHTTWFFETFILLEYAKRYRKFHEKYNYLFNSYYEGAGERVNRSHRGNMTRPTVEEIYKYRQYVDTAMMEFLDGLQEMPSRIAYLLEIGLQHEQQHQELLITDIKYILGNNPLFPAYNKDLTTNGKHEGSNSKYITMEGGLFEIGATTHGFKFDNEMGVHQVYLHPFQFMDRLVTNGEYLEFVESGAYQDFRYWLLEGWEWVKLHQVEAPLYWFKIENKWHHYTMQGLKEVNLYEPIAHVNYFEADAYANWKKKRLLTEFEWEVACKFLQKDIPTGANFLDQGNFRPIAAKTDQLYGDVWEWTQSAYLPYPFFEKEEGALGEYNGKFMVSQMVLRGGSCATMKNHIRPTYRNFFHPDKRWQFTGIRLAESLK